MMNEVSIPAGARVLVTGATGFTGSVLVRKLAQGGARVRAVARASSNLEPFRDLDIEWVRGDVFDPAVVDAAAADVEYVVHIAAAYREAKLSDRDYRNVHVVSTQLLAERAWKISGFKRFVHVSTVGVHGHVENPPADETYRFNPGDIYQRTKAEAEIWLHGFAREKGLPYAVIRPAAIYGPGDRRLLKIFRMATKPVFVVLGRSKGLYHLVHVDDLTRGLCLAAVHPNALGEAFICGSPEAVTIEKIGRIVAKALGRDLRVVRLPVWPFYLAGAVCEAVCRPLRIEPPIYRRRVSFFTKDRSFDTRKIRDRLGFRNRHSDEAGLTETALWYREHGWL